MAESSLLSRILRGALYFPKTLYINFKTLPISDALKFPFIVMGPCSFRGINKKSICIDTPVKKGMIRIGAQKTAKRGIQVNRHTHFICENGGKIVFHGNASIGAGSSLCASGGVISLGDDFSCNNNCFLYSMESISVGDNVLLGWNINIRDNDGHPIYHEGTLCNPNKPIVLHDNIWIASYVDILKGVELASGTIIGTRSLVTKGTTEENTIIGGSPAHKIRDNVTWEHRIGSF